MALDFPASGQALWALFDATGIRPEYLLPVLHLESQFNPAAVNPTTHAAGVDQLMPAYAPAGYSTWAASRQLSQSTVPRYEGMVRQLGPIKSATKAYIANLLPVAVPKATSLKSIIARKGNPTPLAPGLTEAMVYAANAGLDANRDGTIDVADIATLMRAHSSSANTVEALEQTYALRPSETPVADPTLGEDYAQPPPSGEGNSPFMWALILPPLAWVVWSMVKRG